MLHVKYVSQSEVVLSKIKDAVRTVIFATRWEQEYG